MAEASQLLPPRPFEDTRRDQLVAIIESHPLLQYLLTCVQVPRRYRWFREWVEKDGYWWNGSSTYNLSH